MGIEQRVTRLEYLVDLICCWICRTGCPRRGDRSIECDIEETEPAESAANRPDGDPVPERYERE